MSNPKYSIIVVAYRDYASLEKCIGLIRKREEQDYDVWVWDNTPDAERQEKFYGENVFVFKGEQNGFAGGCNRVVRYAKGDTLIFLNPDTEPTGDWLDRMCRGFEEGYDAIGTTSDYIAGKQGWKIWQDYPKPFADTKLIIPVCMAIKAETYREMGGFDESFFLGCEDLDFSWRMQLAGKRMGIATDVFIHHVGHTGFNLTPDKDKIIEAGEARIREKLQDFYGPDVPGSEEIWGCKILPTQLKRPRLSLCMITSVEDADKAFTARHDVWDVVDEIVLVVTGKGYLDKTHDNLKVFEYEWNDDFASARNFALSKCTGDWVLWLDADDRVTPENAALIDALIHKPGTRVAFQVCHFAFKVENVNKDGLPQSVFYQPRLFPRLPGIKWGGLGGSKGYIHETVLESCQDLGLTLTTVPNIVIQHTGYSDAEVQVKKLERNLRLYAKEPDCAFKFYNLGTSYLDTAPQKSIEAFRKALELSVEEDATFIDGCRYFLALALCRGEGMKEGKGNQGVIDEIFGLLNPNSKPDSKFLLGNLLIDCGEHEKGCDTLWAYLKLGDVTDNFGSNYTRFRKMAVDRLTEIGVLAA